ncbi:MAG: hypothetical protein AAGA44_12105 [Pseudomonadota bacterium]
MAKRLTTEEFIAKARSTHGEKYDYTGVVYESSAKKVEIVCPKHGPFFQTPNKHLMGRSCPACARDTRKAKLRHSTEDFIASAQKVHGGLYDYSKTEYLNNKMPVAIICREHGVFFQSPAAHIHQGHGCPLCDVSKKLDSDSFIERARAVHGSRYDYSETDYVDSTTNVVIICSEHGPFEQRPAGHLAGKGCPACGGTQKLTRDRFLKKAREIHGEKYDYTKVRLVNVTTPVTIVCKEHGDFEQTPAKHLLGRGCQKCGGSMLLSTDEFIAKAIVVHGDRYDYSESSYAKATEDVTILCPEHGAFEQRASHHLSGVGCPMCANTGFDPNEPATLYYLAITTDDGDVRYKIGITNHTVEARFAGSDLRRIRIVKVWRFKLGQHAAQKESDILRKFEGDRYFGPDILKRGGNSELFTHDILQLDYQS